MDFSFIRPGADTPRGRREEVATPRPSWRTWLFGRTLLAVSLVPCPVRRGGEPEEEDHP